MDSTPFYISIESLIIEFGVWRRQLWPIQEKWSKLEETYKIVALKECHVSAQFLVFNPI